MSEGNPLAPAGMQAELSEHEAQAASQSAATSSYSSTPACKCQLCCLKGSGEGRQDQNLRLGVKFLSIWSGSLCLLSAVHGEPGVISSEAEGGTSGCIVHREHACLATATHRRGSLKPGDLYGCSARKSFIWLLPCLIQCTSCMEGVLEIKHPMTGHPAPGLQAACSLQHPGALGSRQLAAMAPFCQEAQMSCCDRSEIGRDHNPVGTLACLAQK